MLVYSEEKKIGEYRNGRFLTNSMDEIEVISNGNLIEELFEN